MEPSRALACSTARDSVVTCTEANTASVGVDLLRPAGCMRCTGLVTCGHALAIDSVTTASSRTSAAALPGIELSPDAHHQVFISPIGTVLVSGNLSPLCCPDCSSIVAWQRRVSTAMQSATCVRACARIDRSLSHRTLMCASTHLRQGVTATLLKRRPQVLACQDGLQPQHSLSKLPPLCPRRLSSVSPFHRPFPLLSFKGGAACVSGPLSVACLAWAPSVALLGPARPLRACRAPSPLGARRCRSVSACSPWHVCAALCGWWGGARREVHGVEVRLCRFGLAVRALSACVPPPGLLVGCVVVVPALCSVPQCPPHSRLLAVHVQHRVSHRLRTGASMGRDGMQSTATRTFACTSNTPAEHARLNVPASGRALTIGYIS